MTETTASHYGNWVGVAVWIALYGLFLLFTPLYKKSQRKPATAYMAFVVAYALEMFGVPMSVYFVAWAFGRQLPDGVFWGHTLHQYIGNWGMYLCIALNILAAFLIISGWRAIYKNYWRHKEGAGQLVTDGVYRYIRHPQYAGFLLMTLGLLFEWATIPLLLLYPLLAVLYVRLAKREEGDMVKEFGGEYRAYMEKTNMFFPNPLKSGR